MSPGHTTASRAQKKARCGLRLRQGLQWQRHQGCCSGKQKKDTIRWNYTCYHHVDYYEPGDDHRRVVSVAALIAKGRVQLGVLPAMPLQEHRCGSESECTRLPIKAMSSPFFEEIQQMAQYKTWDHYVAAYLGPKIYGAEFDVRNLHTTQPVRPINWAWESFPMVGRSQHDSLMSAMQSLSSGHQEAALVPWEPISRTPGDTTGTIITDLPQHFRTDARNQYLHGTSGYAIPKI